MIYLFGLDIHVQHGHVHPTQPQLMPHGHLGYVTLRGLKRLPAGLPPVLHECPHFGPHVPEVRPSAHEGPVNLWQVGYVGSVLRDLLKMTTEVILADSLTKRSTSVKLRTINVSCTYRDIFLNMSAMCSSGSISPNLS